MVESGEVYDDKMTEMKFSLPGLETVTLAGQSIDKLIRVGDGDAALLYLYILKTQGQSTSTEAAAALGKNPGSIASSMAVLSRLGLVKLDNKTEAAPPEAHMDSRSEMRTETQPDSQPYAHADEYEPQQRRLSVEDMKREMVKGSVFCSLVEAAQGSLGKIMSPDELLRLFGIYDSLHMAPEVILQLITHCITESRGRSGGRMPSMRYIEKAAYTWEREGIFTLDKAEEYLKALDARKSVRGEIKRAMQIRDREFSETEKRYVDNWISMGYEAGAIAIAYDRTMVKTGKLAWSYMDTIINNWHSKGLLTAQDILEKDRKVDRSDLFSNSKSSSQKFGSADLNDIERMKKVLNKIKEE